MYDGSASVAMASWDYDMRIEVLVIFSHRGSDESGLGSCRTSSRRSFPKQGGLLWAAAGFWGRSVSSEDGTRFVSNY